MRDSVMFGITIVAFVLFFIFSSVCEEVSSMGKPPTVEERLEEAKKLEEEKCLVLSVEALLEEKDYLDASLLAKENCE